jgi:hypothetical protein
MIRKLYLARGYLKVAHACFRTSLGVIPFVSGQMACYGLMPAFVQNSIKIFIQLVGNKQLGMGFFGRALEKHGYFL